MPKPVTRDMFSDISMANRSPAKAGQKTEYDLTLTARCGLPRSPGSILKTVMSNGKAQMGQINSS